MPTQFENGGETTPLVQAEERRIETIESRPAAALSPAVEQKITHVHREGRVTAHADSSFDDHAQRDRAYRQYDQLSRQFQSYDRMDGQYRQEDAITVKYARYDRIGDRYRALDATPRGYPR
jgi:hypothetical protein